MSDLDRRTHRAVSDDSDALTVLGWGLRHYWWIVLLSVCAVGVAVPLVVDRAPETYEAQAQVGPAAPLGLNNIDILPRLGDSVFRNGAVAQAVRDSFERPLPRSEDVIPDRVSLITAQDNVVLSVVGHASEPEDAARLANVAAETLRDQLNNYDEAVGTFTVQRSAVPPGKPTSRVGLAPSVAAGVLAGLLVALGIIGLLLLRRRPVLSTGSAEAATGAPVLGQVWLGRTSDEARGLPHFCHTLMSFQCEELLLVGASRTATHRHRITRLLGEVLAGRRDVVSLDEHRRERPRARAKQGRPTPHGPQLRVAQHASQSQLVGRSDRSVVVLVVPYGVARTSLARQVEQYLDGGPGGVLLVRHPSRRSRLKRSRPTPERAPSHPLPQTVTGLNGVASRNGSTPSATPTTTPTGPTATPAGALADGDH